MLPQVGQLFCLQAKAMAWRQNRVRGGHLLDYTGLGRLTLLIYRQVGTAKAPLPEQGPAAITLMNSQIRTTGLTRIDPRGVEGVGTL
jgi:hypothetical protein